MSNERPQTTLKTTNTSFEILDYIKRSEGRTLTDIINEFDLARSSAYAHLNTMERRGFLIREGGLYRIGMRFLDYSKAAESRNPSYNIIEREARKLSTEIQYEVEFLVEENYRVILLFHSEGTSPNARRYMFLHNTAAGKAILAEYTNEVISQAISQWGLPQETPHTLTTEAELMDELKLTRDRGYAYNEEECFEGYHGVGVAVSNPNGRPIGALTIGGPIYRVSKESLHNDLADLLKEVAEDIEQAIRD